MGSCSSKEKNLAGASGSTRPAAAAKDSFTKACSRKLGDLKDASRSSESNESKLLYLPQSVLLIILSWLELADIERVSETCKTMHAAADDGPLWKALAFHRYGASVTRSTLHLYTSYKEMIVDDNCRGALPTLHGLWKSPWHSNSPGGPFYCCLIICIKWHRPSNRLWLYLDARGESDLRLPGTSGVWFRELGATNNVVRLEDRIIPNQDGSVYLMDLSQNVREYVFVPEGAGAVRRNGRFKGVLQIDASLFSRTGGSYEFCYANANRYVHRDYGECALFTLKHGQTLMDAFPTYSLESESPFASDTEAVWTERWAPHLIAFNILNRLGPWPECIGMRGVEAANYIRSQNPDLKVRIYSPGQPMFMYYRDTEVRFWVNRRGRVDTAPIRG